MATPADQLERVKRKRTVLRIATTKLLHKIEGEIQKEVTDYEMLDVTLGQLIQKEDALSKVDDEIEGLIEDLDALEAEVANREEYREKVSEGRTKAARKMKNDSETGRPREPPAQAPMTNTTTATTVRLPRLSIEKFNGSACEWQTFWAQFKAAIHENRSLDQIDKFSYLKAYLEGTAAAAVTGLPLNSENYGKAIDILTKRFGRRETLISAHMNRLLTLTPVKRSHDLTALRRLYDECEVQIRSLDTMGMTSDAYGSLLCPLLFKLIPDDLALDFNRRRDEQQDVQVDELLAFIRKELESRERTLIMTQKEDNFTPDLLIPNSQRTSRSTHPEINKRGSRSASAAALNATVEENCIFCNKSTHKTDECTALSIPEKKDILRKCGRCYICYRKGHLAKFCRMNITCPVCRKRHRKGLCGQLNQQELSNGNTVVSSILPECKQQQNPTETILLQTVRAEAMGKRARFPVRCLLDGGSQRTFVTVDLSRQLQLPVVGEEELKLHTFGGESPKNTKLRRVRIQLRQTNDRSKLITVEALEIPEICTSLIQVPSRELQTKMEVEGLQLSDIPTLGETSCRINMLIGADFYWRVVTGGIRRLSDSLVAIDTLLGWSVQGAAMISNLAVNSQVGIMNVIVNNWDSEEQLASMQLKKFWDLDSIGVVEKCGDMPKDEEVRQNFEETVIFNEDRYEVRLPWKGEHVGWPNNFELAEKRLHGLIRKLKRNPSMFIAYNEILEEQLAQGIIEEIPEADISAVETQPVFYLPHQAVMRPDKTTTKMRIVFDASAHTPNSPSLNDLLHAGPNLNPDLLNLLIRFRTNRIAIAADIEKAFLQIGLAKEDRDAVRFLWFEGMPDEEIKIRTLRMKRVLFGVTSSPFLLAAVIKHHVEKHEDHDQETCKSLKDSLYVDDWMSGAANVEKAFKLSNEARGIMKEASFTLRKWQTNSESLKVMWKDHGYDISNETALIGEQDLPTKVLGLLWNTKEDIFKFNVSHVLEFLSTRTKTKRCVLQAAGRIFDPIGFLSPFIVRVKIMFQELWECGLHWDQELPEPVREKWDAWCLELTDLHQLSVPRYCFSESGEFECHDKQLHCFTDASTKAYGAVVYLRYATSEGSYKVALVASKTRVAPLKRMSIPRLELMGALIGARLVTHVKKVFPPEENISYYLWTDSLITLCWIRSTAANWKPFVSNRIQELQSLTDPDQWQHCPGTENPADHLTRGRKVHEIAEDKFWWEGPSWLAMESGCWPKTPQDKIAQNQENNERRNLKSITQGLLTSRSSKNPLLDLTRFSRLSRVLRVTAWIYRFVQNTKKNGVKSRGPLEASEMLKAELYWVKETQMQAFENEVIALSSRKYIERTSRIATLTPFLDKDGAVRVGGRLQFSNLTYEERHPLLIPDKNAFATLLIKDSHERVAHSGVGDTLAQVRGRMWILRARQQAKTIINECQLCKRFRVKPLTEEMAPLPKNRVQPSPPFEITGVDFAGPIYVGKETTSEKSYIALFTCAVTRAIHLELVSDMTTERFILAFRRFIARRGICKVVYSDNAKTFKAAARKFKTAWDNIQEAEMKEFYGTQGITWLFIVERAAWWGGFWERLVRSVKTSLKKILGRASLSFEELTTVLTQVEAVINSRPMTYTSSDTEDQVALAPSHFLIGKRLTALPEKMTPTTPAPSTRRRLARRFKYQQTILDGFWKQWSHQYLMELRSAHHRTPTKETAEIQEGDVMLLYDHRTPRLLWKMCRVETTYRGRDSKVRSCSLRLSDGTLLKRPIQLLYPLEVQPVKTNQEANQNRSHLPSGGREDVVTSMCAPAESNGAPPYFIDGTVPGLLYPFTVRNVSEGGRPSPSGPPDKGENRSSIQPDVIRTPDQKHPYTSSL